MTILAHPVDPTALSSFVTRLDEVTSDDLITGRESCELETLARAAGLGQIQLVEIHRAAWARMVGEEGTIDPDLIPEKRRAKLVQLAHDLGHPGLASGLAECVRNEPIIDTHLRGWRIGVDGESAGLDSLINRVVHRGGAIAKRLTSTVRFVAAVDPSAATPNLAKAQAQGLRVLRVEEAAAEVDRAIRSEETKRDIQRREDERWEADRAREEAEREAYFTHKWCRPEREVAWEWPD